MKELDSPLFNSMVRGLEEGFKKARRLSIHDMFLFKINRQYREDIKYMNSMADELIESRIKNGAGEKDLLYTMLNSKDPVTGEKLSNENIRYQLITFLVAGHETILALALLLQKFEFSFADPSYKLKIKETLTFKPENFKIKVHLRKKGQLTGSHFPDNEPDSDISIPPGCPYHTP